MTALTMKNDSMGRWLGTTIADRFEVREAIGRGGMAEVYRAHDRRLTRDVAIKILRTDTGREIPDRVRLLAEARTVARLWHPHIVAVHDVGELEEGVVYIVMELMLGCSVADLLAGGEPIEPAFVLEICSQIASALAAAHDMGVLHRDVKPENLYLMDSVTGTLAKLLDFSVARTPANDKGTRLTAKDMIFGTPYYMSPEQTRGEDVGPASDLYSLGVVMFEMLTGEVPFLGTNAIEVMAHHRSTPAPDLEPRCPDLPIGVAELVAQLLEKEPEDRPASSDEVMDRLAGMLAAIQEREIRHLVPTNSNASTAAYSTLSALSEEPAPYSKRTTARELSGLLDLDGPTAPYGIGKGPHSGDS